MKSVGVWISTRCGSTWTEAEESAVSLSTLKRPTGPNSAHRQGMQAEIEIFLDRGGMEHRNAGGHEGGLALVGRVDDLAMWSSPASATMPPCFECRLVGVLEGVARAIDARSLAVPHAEHAIVAGAGIEVDLLGAPQGRGRQVFVDAGLEVDGFLL